MSDLIAEILKDSLSPEAARHVLVTACVAVEETDKRWRGKGVVGTPSVTDYSQAVREQLAETYGWCLDP